MHWPVVPDRIAQVGQFRQLAQITETFTRTMKVGTARNQQLPVASMQSEAPDLIRCVTGGDDLDRRSSCRAECFEQIVEYVFAHVVASRVGDDGTASTALDPFYCVIQGGPLVRSIARLAFDQVMFENGFDVLGMTLFNEKTCKMGASNQPSFSDMRISTFKASMYADLVQLGSNIFGALRTTRADFGQALNQRLVIGVDIQSDDMDGAIAPADRYFHAINKCDIFCFGRLPGFGQSGDIIVIGQGQGGYAAGSSTIDQLGWGEQAIGNGGVTMQIYVEHVDGYRPKAGQA